MVSKDPASSEHYDIPWTSQRRRRNLLAGYDVPTETVLFPGNATLGKTPTSFDAPQMVIAGHELAHHTQMISTLYGALIRSIDSLRNDLIRKFFIVLYDLKLIPPIRVPLIDMVKELKKAPSAPGQEAIANLEQSLYILRLREAFEGSRNYPLSELEYALQTFSQYLSPEYLDKRGVLSQLLITPAPPDVERLGDITNSSPILNGEPFGGLHILEALAWMTEVVHVGGRAENPPPTSQFDDGAEKLDISSIYQYAFFYYLQHRVGTENISRIFKLPTVYGVEHILGFLAAAHVALMVPLHPAFQIQIFAGCSWYDLQPGWRFVRICNALADVPRVLPDLSNYEKVQEFICKKFNWPGPRAIWWNCKDLLDALPRKREPDVHSLDLVRVCEAIVESEEFPWCMIFTPARYPGIDPAFKKILQQIGEKYGPTIIQSDFGIAPGWRATIEDVFFRLFKDNREHFLTDEILRTFGVRRPPREQYHAEYALSSFLVQGWLDYVMATPQCDPVAFISELFPPAQGASIRMHFLLSLLETGSLMYTFGFLNQYVNHRTGKPVIDFVLHLPPNVSQEEYELFAKMVKKQL